MRSLGLGIAPGFPRRDVQASRRLPAASLRFDHALGTRVLMDRPENTEVSLNVLKSLVSGQEACDTWAFPRLEGPFARVIYANAGPAVSQFCAAWHRPQAETGSDPSASASACPPLPRPRGRQL